MQNKTDGKRDRLKHKVVNIIHQKHNLLEEKGFYVDLGTHKMDYLSKRKHEPRLRGSNSRIISGKNKAISIRE